MKILLIRFGRVGDVVLSLGVANAIKETFPDSVITLLTDESIRSLTSSHNSLDKKIYWEKALWKKQPKLKVLVAIIKSILELRRQKFDVAIDLQGFFETALITYLTGAKTKVGYDEKNRGIFYNVKVKPWSETRHDFTMQLKLASVIGVDTNNAVPSIVITKEASDYRDKFLSSVGVLKTDKIIGLNPSASVYYKRWNENNFALLSDKLIEKYNAKVIIFWGPGEEPIASKVKQLMKQGAILCCKTSLMELSAFIEKCKVFLTNDSGPMHIAAALGVPTFAVFISEHSRASVSSPIGLNNRVFIVKENATKDENDKTIENIVNSAGSMI